MADVRRLRGTKNAPGFASTLHAKALARAIGRLRAAENLPLEGDSLVEFWGSERCWAHRFTPLLWIYYKIDLNGSGEDLVLMAVHDHLHEQ